MKKALIYIAAAVTLVFGVAAFIFFGFGYTYHLHYQEQYQLFQFTASYAADVMGVPGGTADYAGRFLTQFCYHARAGAAIIALLLVAIQIATFLVARRRESGIGANSAIYAFSFIPAITMWLFLCDENALLGAPVALLLALVAAIAVPCRRIPLQVVIQIALYWLLGPVSIVYLLARGAVENKWWKCAVAPAAIFLCALACHSFLSVSLWDLCFGVHYYRYRNIFQMMLWFSVLSSALIIAAGRIRPLFKKDSNETIFASVLLLLLIAGTVPLVRSASDMEKEEIMKYDFMVRMKMWNRILGEASKKTPDNPMTVCCLNLALSQTGNMGEHMFDYFQNGPQGIISEFTRDFTAPMPTSEVYYYLGLVNTAQRFTFEIEEAIPDYQKSARCYKRLAETNIINGDYDVARKYLNALTHTIFYRKWALSALSLPGYEKAIEAHPEYGRMRKLRFKERDFLFSDGEMDSMLGLLFFDNHQNSGALDYLLAWTLLGKNLTRFGECLSMVQFQQMPRSYQEALLLLWAQTHDKIEGCPRVISNKTIDRFYKFSEAVNSGKDATYMERAFGNTYWFYYMYRYTE